MKDLLTKRWLDSGEYTTPLDEEERREQSPEPREGGLDLREDCCMGAVVLVRWMKILGWWSDDLVLNLLLGTG